MVVELTQTLPEMSTNKSYWVRDRGGAVKRDLCMRLIISSLSMILLSRKCGILDVSQFFGPPLPVTRIASLGVLFPYCTLSFYSISLLIPESVVEPLPTDSLLDKSFLQFAILFHFYCFNDSVKKRTNELRKYTYE
jgi:hypothetical protein